ncbi:MAG: sulfotransferase domain-containing protein [Candidatus Binataceae bacterium]
MRKTVDARLPSFIGVGPARTGTTWVHSVLEGYVGLPRRTKETDFFSTNYGLGLDWYRTHFCGYPAEMVVGEITPTYFDHPEAPARIAELIPECKTFVSLRDPVQRLYSHYRLLRVEGWIGRLTFEEALQRHDRWAERAGNMIGVNRYALHLNRWFQALGKPQVLVTFYDDLERDPQGYIDQLAAFIGVGRIELAQSPIGTKPVNLIERAPKHPHLAARARRLRDTLERQSRYRLIRFLRPLFRYYSGGGEPFQPLDPHTDSALRQRFRSEVEAVEQLSGRDLKHWKTPH